jgi:sulfonate transport system substrate-binding protein
MEEARESMYQASAKRLLVGLMAASMVVVACGGPGATQAPTAAPPTPAPTGGEQPSEPAGFELPKPEVSSIRIGQSVTETSQFAARLALMAGIFEKYGLNVEMTVFEGDGRVMQALQAGQIEIGFGGTSSPITSQLTDVPVVSIAVMAKILTDELVAAPDIKTADDLRGKCVAVSTFGGTAHGAVLLSLDALGLTPEDVVITEVGGQSARIAAVQTGACAAAPIDQNRHDEMAAAGLNFLVNLAEAKLPWGRSGMNIRKDWLAEHPNTALVALAAVLEAQNMIWTDPDTAAKHYAEFIQVDEAEAKRLILEFQDVGNRSLEWEDEAFGNPHRVLATVNEALLTIDFRTAFDRSYIEKLREGGFMDELGIPEG